jgi:hypothetical protein
MMDLRNKLLAHSSIEGTKVLLFAPGAILPANGGTASDYGYSPAKLSFIDPEFVPWLHYLVKAMTNRLVDDIATISRAVCGNYLKTQKTYHLETGKNPFRWTK